jgi:hypothetical protein
MANITRPEAGASLLDGKPDHTSYASSWLIKLLVGQRNLFAPASDPAQTGHAHRKNLGLHGSIRHGYVVDYVAYARCYRVFLDNNHPIMPCASLMQGSATPWGARSLSSITPGSCVQVVVHPQRNHGYIIGVEPRKRSDAADNKADWISQSGRCGVRVDDVHRQVFQCEGKGGVVDWSTNRPMDSLAGEEGWIAETGLRVALDPFMVQLAVNEACGVFGFYHDDLLRIAAYNLHHFTCGGELEVLDDEGEVRWVGGDATFPWEQTGLLVPGGDPFRDVDPQAAQVGTPYYSYVEPKHDTQVPFHRALDFRGYLGQGGKRMTVVPPPGDVYTAEGEGPQGVFEDFRSLTGRWAVRSAKGIHLVKQGAIPAPHPRKRPEDRSGDTAGNYRASGLEGGGPAHRVVGGPRTSGPAPHLQQAMAIVDLHAWVFNWEACHPFHYHDEDWDLPEEAETRLGGGATRADFGALASDFYLPRPGPVSLHVDHRYGDVDYYPNEAALDLNDDGTVVLSDGYGAEIRMAGGHIFFNCPGDVWLMPGRNINGWAGRDLCLKARNSFDISATDADGRLKAEKNLHVLGGNDGRVGGVLVESNAPSSYRYDGVVGEDVVSGGVQLRAGKGCVATWSRDVYIRTGGGDVESGGEIIIDADKGKGAIVTNSKFTLNYATEVIADYLGAEGEVKVANVYGTEGNVMGKSLQVLGFGLFKGTVLVEGWFEAIGGHIATEMASDPTWVYVAALSDKPLTEAREVMESAVEAEKEAVDVAKESYRKTFTEYWYAEDGAGRDETIRAAHFTFRSGEHYRTKDFELYEARWQQLARMAHTARVAWKERPVAAAGRETYPYPGKAAWADGAHLHGQDLALHDADRGVARGRAASLDAYERPAYEAGNDPVPLEDNYVVIL